MKKVFIENLIELLKAESAEERSNLQIKLHHIIVTSKLVFDDITAESMAKNHIIDDIKAFVENPIDVYRNNLLIQLQGFPLVIKD